MGKLSAEHPVYITSYIHLKLLKCIPHFTQNLKVNAVHMYYIIIFKLNDATM